MAKKATIRGLFDRTDETERKGKLRPLGIYLRKDIRAAAEQIVEAEGLTMHALLAYAVAYFIREYKAGRAKIETVKKVRPRMDI